MTFDSKAVFYYSHESWEYLWKFIVKPVSLQCLEHIPFLALGFLCAEVTESQNGRGWKGPLWLI